MCLIVIAVSARTEGALIVAANRDELFSRPTRPASFWADRPEIFAGRDLEKGGTWMGITRNGRFAAVTNLREPSARKDAPRSRGWIVSSYLSSSDDPLSFSRSLPRDELPAFNLICGTTDELFYVTDDQTVPLPIAPGIHAVSNARLDVPWPKVEKGRAAMLAFSDTEPLFEMLDDRTTAPDDLLPKTGVPLEVERALSAPHIVMGPYGTRSSTVIVARSRGEIWFEERTWDERGREKGRVKETFVVRS